jgi:hypothetical protein
MTSDQICQALANLRPGAQWAVLGNTYADIQWLDPVQSRPTETELTAEIARSAALPPPTLADKIDAATFKILFNHENRIRALEAKAAITVAQFKAALLTLLGG